MVSAAYATKLIADLGAEVIKVEEPGGDRARQRGPFPHGIADPEQSRLFLYLNTNKQGVTLDLDKNKDALAHLVAWADLLIHNYPPAEMAALGINYSSFRAINPRLVMCSLTAFGLTGAYKDYRAYELTVAHWRWVGVAESGRVRSSRLTAAQSGRPSGRVSRGRSGGHGDVGSVLSRPA
jgi:crotonobetainyl-CoA:carnitine CoA-transferase CaiB-like acyl-CoA transferase